MQHTTIRRIAAGLLAVALVGSGAGAAQAKGGSDKEGRRSGQCSAATVWKLKAKTDDGRLEIEFTSERHIANRARTDRITATLQSGIRLAQTNAKTGERCYGGLVHQVNPDGF